MQRLTATSWACIVSGVLSLLAVAPWPYGYYVFLRWVVCGSSIAGGIALSEGKRPIAALPAWGLAILFNPLFKIPLDRQVWMFVDVLAAGLLLAMGLLSRTTEDGRGDPSE